MKIYCPECEQETYRWFEKDGKTYWCCPVCEVVTAMTKLDHATDDVSELF